ncbi:unnamed protein product [Heligmosomoides polygyrus]|uniref:Phosphoribulokinase n=1 Tax=Heligmosomoides polygyrus TaxID=6339 RepID=A0A183G3X2_HELPZ|nr:unnamed protein product [Heligmosomoides polygyrus]
MLDKVKEIKHEMQPYIEETVGDFKFTFISMQKPQSSLMDRRFAMSTEESLVIPENYRIPIECTTADEQLQRVHTTLRLYMP